MNKYSEMSDGDIEHLIAEKLEGKSLAKGIDRNRFIPKICSRNEDAFKLMIDNGISLIKHPDFYDAVYEFGSLKQIRCIHENPRRAIAECYLLIKDIGNA